MIDWKNIGKIRIANPSKSFYLHEITKLLMVMKIMNLHSNEKQYIHIYTEFVIKGNRKADIFYENLKTKEGYVIEIQKKDGKEWERDLIDFYKDFNISYLNSVDLIIIRLKDLPTEINELSKKLNEYVV